MNIMEKTGILLPLLYLNDGKGNMTRKPDAFSDIYSTQSVIIPYDFNGDGFVDLFIGGRAEPWNYGTIPRSYLLQNDGSGKFFDVTEKYSKDLMFAGMVTDAQWVDIDKDGDKDLVLLMNGAASMYSLIIKIVFQENRSLIKKAGGILFCPVISTMMATLILLSVILA